MSKVKVRIAVAVDPTGAWNAYGWGTPGVERSDKDVETMVGLTLECVGVGERLYWVEAELDVPEPETVLASAVTPGTDE